MIIGLLSTLFTLSCILLILLVLIQKGKGSMGLGSMGGGSQMLFGGSGGQDLFQKMTWILGAIIIAGSLGLSWLKMQQQQNSPYLNHYKAPIQQNFPVEPEGEL